MNRDLVLFVGPPGAGKSSMARELCKDGKYVYINQDSQGKAHLTLFEEAIKAGKSVVVDRLNFVKNQRDRYLVPAKQNGYVTQVFVLHQPYKICMERMLKRTDHETIKDETSARSALNMFFSKYERVQDTEADFVHRCYPDGEKPKAIWSDLDGTLCDVTHRRHFVRREAGQRKDWKGFFEAMIDDAVNRPVADVLDKFRGTNKIVLCSGRPDNYRRETNRWLDKHGILYDNLFMRLRNDQRQDNVVKEILLDFEVLTRYEVVFCMDDRDQVVKMLRDRGLTVFQVAEGDF